MYSVAEKKKGGEGCSQNSGDNVYYPVSQSVGRTLSKGELHRHKR